MAAVDLGEVSVEEDSSFFAYPRVRKELYKGPCIRKLGEKLTDKNMEFDQDLAHFLPLQA